MHVLLPAPVANRANGVAGDNRVADFQRAADVSVEGLELNSIGQLVQHQ